MKRKANNLLVPRNVFFAVLVLVAGCGGGGGTIPPPPSVAPSVTTQPASQTVTAGQTATFTVVAAGTSPLNYQWAKNGTAISGATSSSYTTPATTAADNGSQFAVVVSNVVGSVTSASATLTVTSVTSVTVTCNPTTVLVNQTSQCSAAVQGTGNFSSSVTWSANAGTVSASGLFTAPASAGTATITAKSVQDPTKSGTANVTVNPPSPLSVSVSPATATVVLGGSQNMTASSNDSTAIFTWSLTGPGKLSSTSGAAIAYQADAICLPSAWSVTVTVTATSGAQTAAATVQVALEYPVPTVTSISLRNIFSVREAIISVVVTGSGFCIGGSFHLVGTDMSAGATNVSFNQFTLVLGFDSAHFAPGAYGLTVSSPTDGHGGGTSTSFRFSFIGNKNTVALSATQIFQLDQGAGIVHVFDLATLAFVRDINVGRLVYAITVGDGFLYATAANGVGLYVVGNPTAFPSIPAIHLPMGVAEKNGSLCLTQDQDNLLACVDITQANPAVVTASIGTTPMEVAMTTTASGQLSAVVLNAGDGTIAVAPVPLPAQGTVIPSVRLPGMTIGHGEQTGTSGGTQLTMLEYTNNQSVPVRIAAVTSRFDKLIWFVDVSNPAQSMPIVGPFPLSGDPYRLAVDTAGKVFVLALADYNTADGSAITRLVRVNPTSGVQTNLNSTVPFIASGLAVNPVSGQIIACGGANCVQVPNN